jgi:hypothetical protein
MLSVANGTMFSFCSMQEMSAASDPEAHIVHMAHVNDFVVPFRRPTAAHVRLPFVD